MAKTIIRKATLFCIYSLFIFTYSCDKNKTYTKIQGRALGTYYNIVYDKPFSLKKEVDSIIYQYELAASTYIDSSEISKFNTYGKLRFTSDILPDMLEKAKHFYLQSNKALNPALMPIIKAWGFSKDNKVELSDHQIDSLLDISSMEYLFWDKQTLSSKKKGVMLDFSFFGEGYAIDMIANFLSSKGAKNYMVEIGGEMLCNGANPMGNPWKIGIETPLHNAQKKQIATIVKLTDKALSTSGSYRKYFVDKSGKKRPHIISPFSGKPVEHSLLSASIISDKGIVSDALATSCMVVGTEAAKKLIENTSNIEGLLIYEENKELKTWKSKGFKKYLY